MRPLAPPPLRPGLDLRLALFLAKADAVTTA
jgi:hypothetical protein